MPCRAALPLRQANPSLPFKFLATAVLCLAKTSWRRRDVRAMERLRGDDVKRQKITTICAGKAKARAAVVFS